MSNAVMKPLDMDVHGIFVRRECTRNMGDAQAIESRKALYRKAIVRC